MAAKKTEPAKPRRPLAVQLTTHRRRLLRKYAKRDGMASAAWVARVVSVVLDEREKAEKAARQLNLFEWGDADGSQS